MPKSMNKRNDRSKATTATKGSLSHQYGLTVRHNPTYKENGEKYTISEKKALYERLIGRLEQRGLKIDNLYYEEKGGLHFHARATYSKKLYYKAWQVKPFHILFKNIYDESGWLSYCQKEQKKHDLTVYQNEYCFMSSDYESE